MARIVFSSLPFGACSVKILASQHITILSLPLFQIRLGLSTTRKTRDPVRWASDGPTSAKLGFGKELFRQSVHSEFNSTNTCWTTGGENGFRKVNFRSQFVSRLMSACRS